MLSSPHGGSKLSSSPNRAPLLLANLVHLDQVEVRALLLYYLFYISRSIAAGAFAQPQPQQQPVANPMFGNLSAPANPAPAGGFGALTAFLYFLCHLTRVNRRICQYQHEHK